MNTRGFKVPPFAQRCIEAAGTAWGASFNHPFVLALAKGTLDADKFRFYQMQDARYLEAFADTASLISTRCVDPIDKLWFIDAARMALIVEGELHAGYGEKLGYNADDVAAIQLTPNNRGYQNHMISTAQRGSLLEAVAALAPCPWLYIELGQHLMRELGGAVDDNHPYANWLRMYADPGFNDYMDNMLTRMEAFANQTDEATRLRAIDAFVTSARYEYMFWDQSWTFQQWPT